MAYDGTGGWRPLRNVDEQTDMNDEQHRAIGDSSQTHPRDLTMADRKQLRRLLRQRRNALSPASQLTAALRVAHLLRRHALRPQLRIAIYHAFDGEIDLTPTVRIAKRLNCSLYAPCIVDEKNRRMEFVRLGDTPARSNRLGIVEPRYAPSRRIDARQLDLILIAVVAFDAFGWRLGFGGGYYDRKLAFKRHRRLSPPRLVGVAYDFQRVAPVIPAPWDVLLDHVVTPQGWLRCGRPRTQTTPGALSR